MEIKVPDDIVDDVDEIFHFDKEVRPQDREHAYLARFKVRRGWSDTAMQVAVHHIVTRAYAAGLEAGAAPDEGVSKQLRAAHTLLGQALASLSV